MTSDQTLRVRALFEEAFELSADQRDELLNQRCGDDLDLRREIDDLLSAHENLGSFMAEPVVDLADFRLLHSRVATSHSKPSTSDSRPTLNARQLNQFGEGEWLGPYQILRELGAGGHGTVFLGRLVLSQSGDDRQAVNESAEERVSDSLVAIKRLHAVLDDERSRDRFARERELLSLLRHDNVARFLDAGVSGSGEPYVVMEFIDGVPITDYCRSREIALETRLIYFQSLCDGVNHAHQKQIIHRDLKPGNVLVDLRDGQAVPKVIDFGIAKAFGELASSERERLAFPITRTTDGAPGTPQYMSPEQLADPPVPVDTRADVYALGAILYELLVDQPAFDPPWPGPAGLADLVLRIRKGEIELPADRLARLALDAHDEFGIPINRPTRRIKDDLNWIVAKAMALNPSKRYPSADALSADIGRYLRNEPIAARPPGWVYRLRKFARRHRVAVAVTLIVLALLLSALVGTSFGLRKAWIAQAHAETSAAKEAKQRQAAESSQAAAIASEKKTREESEKLLAAQQFLFSLLTTTQSSDGAPPKAPSVALLDDVSRRADEHALKHRPEVEAPLRAALGRAYVTRKDYEKAERQFTRLLELSRGLYPPGHREIASALHLVGQSKLFQLHYKSAEALLRESLVMYRRLDAGDSIIDVPVLEDLSVVLANTGRLGEAESLLREIVRQYRAVYDLGHPLVQQSLDRLARVLQAEGKAEEAEQIRQLLHQPPPAEDDTMPSGSDQVI